jgi:hypothetical protein
MPREPRAACKARGILREQIGVKTILVPEEDRLQWPEYGARSAAVTRVRAQLAMEARRDGLRRRPRSCRVA